MARGFLSELGSLVSPAQGNQRNPHPYVQSGDWEQQRERTSEMTPREQRKTAVRPVAESQQ